MSNFEAKLEALYKKHSSNLVGIFSMERNCLNILANQTYGSKKPCKELAKKS